MTKNSTLVLAAILFLSITAAAQKDGLSKVNFNNFAYTTSVCSRDIGLPKTVKVNGGEFKDDENYFKIRDEPLYGRLAGQDVVIIHAMCGGMAGNFSDSEIYVFAMQKGRGKLLGRVDTSIFERDYKRSFKNGFIVGVHSVKLMKGDLVVTAFTDGSNASPRYKSSLTYKLAAGRLAVSGKPVRRSSGIGKDG